MPVAVTCPKCQASFQAPEQAQGKSVRCAKCQHQFTASWAMPEWLGGAPAPAAAEPAAASPASSNQVTITCPACHSSFRAVEQVIGKSVRCLKCQNQFQAAMAAPDWVTPVLADAATSPFPGAPAARPAPNGHKSAPIPARRSAAPAPVAEAVQAEGVELIPLSDRPRSSWGSGLAFGLMLGLMLGVVGLACVWLYTSRIKDKPSGSSESAPATPTEPQPETKEAEAP